MRAPPPHPPPQIFRRCSTAECLAEEHADPRRAQPWAEGTGGGGGATLYHKHSALGTQPTPAPGGGQLPIIAYLLPTRPFYGRNRRDQPQDPAQNAPLTMYVMIVIVKVSAPPLLDSSSTPSHPCEDTTNPFLPPTTPIAGHMGKARLLPPPHANHQTSSTFFEATEQLTLSRRVAWNPHCGHLRPRTPATTCSCPELVARRQRIAQCRWKWWQRPA